MDETGMNEKNNKKRTVLVAVVLMLLFLGSCIWILLADRPAGSAARVCIYQDGVLLEEYPLSADGVYRIEQENGAFNVIEIKGGSVRVSEANCENQVCVQTGAITSGAYPIVCLPHKLVVRIEDGEKELDGAAR